MMNGKELRERFYSGIVMHVMKEQRWRLRAIVGWGIRAILAAFFIGGATIAVLFFYYAKALPRPERYTEAAFSQPTEVYDRTGKVLLYELYKEQKRTPVKLEEVPENLQHAIIATEDADFYSHFGVDVSGTFRAVLVNLIRLNPKK